MDIIIVYLAAVPSRSLAPAHEIGLIIDNLLNAPIVFSAPKIGYEPLADDFLDLPNRIIIRAKGQDVGLIVLAGEDGVFGVERQDGAYSGNPVGGQYHAVAGTAYQDSTVCLAARYQFAHFESENGMVTGLVRIRPAIDYLDSG